ncbi:prephenate dehydrogenase/arogenate dehydrogenase family protein [bacterium]|nr:prephenate dehydrogenase/arogenate dehydrogenase family protein [bacterium]
MKIGIIGLGLIGGSIFKDLISLGYEVVGISNSQNGENIFQDYTYLKDCNLIFVCHAMNKTLETLDKLENYLSSETIVTDVCSLKEFVSKKKYTYKFIPSHPMAGTENKGFENSFEGLFKGAKWAICPLDEDKNVLNVLIEIVKKLGAEPVLTIPKEHDEAVALISHMPMVISQALFLAAEDNPLAMKLAASGFKSMTRLAMSNEEMAVDMVNMNHKNIENSILKLYKAVGDLTGGNYPELISKIKQKRKIL